MKFHIIELSSGYMHASLECNRRFVAQWHKGADPTLSDCFEPDETGIEFLRWWRETRERTEEPKR